MLPVLVNSQENQISQRLLNCTDFVPAKNFDRIFEGSLVRRSRDTLQGLASSPQIIFDHGETLEIFPGTLFQIEGSGVRLLLGRIHVVIPENSTGFSIHGSQNAFEIQKGEAWAEADEYGNFSFALSKGSGWIKGRERKIVQLRAGTQVSIPKNAPPEKLREMDVRWKESFEGFAPISSLLKKPQPDSEEIPHEPESNQASETENTPNSPIEETLDKRSSESETNGELIIKD
ncbi:hypothetical protein HYY75_10285 [bacterium]|nr:hypothetical protein [bacterium]